MDEFWKWLGDHDGVLRVYTNRKDRYTSFILTIPSLNDLRKSVEHRVGEREMAFSRVEYNRLIEEILLKMKKELSTVE